MSIEFDKRLFGFGNERVRDRLVDIGIAWRRIPLSAQRSRAPHDLFGRIGDVCGLVDQGRILAAKFEQNRRKILGCGPRNDLSDLGAAREKDEVEGKLQEFGCFLAASRYGADRAGVEVFRHELEQHRRRGR
jgi:hypothetical protein